MTEAYIYDAVRSPRGKGRPDGALHEITPIDLASQVLAANRDRNGLSGAEIEDVAFGCVSPVGEQGAVITRTAILAAGYPHTTSGIQVNRFCGSGLEASNIAAAKVKSGECDLAVGGGIESMSRVPMGSDGGAWPIDPRSAIANYFIPQGISADLIATKYVTAAMMLMLMPSKAKNALAAHGPKSVLRARSCQLGMSLAKSCLTMTN